MKTRVPCLLILVLIALRLMEIVSRAEPVPAATAEVPVASYTVRGVVKGVDSEKQQASIAHEAIPGFMAAMTMTFDVRDRKELRGLQPGDTLAFQLRVTKESAWIEQLQKTGPVDGLPITPPRADARAELNVGDLLPDVELVNQEGRKFRLSEFRGNALAITFVYTRCPLPTYCPLTNRNFGVTQTLLARLGSHANWRMISISLDSKNDTPEILAAYAATYHADPKSWQFVTARDEAIRALGDPVGLEFSRSGLQINHNLRTVVVDTAGCIRHVFRGNTWTPQELAAELRSAMR